MEKIVGDSMIAHSNPQSSSPLESGSKILDKTNEKKKATMGTGTTVSDSTASGMNSTVSGIFKVLTVGKYQPYGEEKENHTTLSAVKNTVKNSNDKNVNKKIDKVKERLLEYEKSKEKRMKMMRETEKEMEMKKTKERRKAMNKIFDGKKVKVKEGVKKSSSQNIRPSRLTGGGVGGGGEKEMRSSVRAHIGGDDKEKDGNEDGRVERMLKFSGSAEATGNEKTDSYCYFYSCSFHHSHFQSYS